jgi:hypothetical protein
VWGGRGVEILPLLVSAGGTGRVTGFIFEESVGGEDFSATFGTTEGVGLGGVAVVGLFGLRNKATSLFQSDIGDCSWLFCSRMEQAHWFL